MSQWQCAKCGIRSGVQLCAHEWVERAPEDDTEPVMVEVRDGWFAVGNGWAVFAPLDSTAFEKYREAQRLHAEISARRVEWEAETPEIEKNVLR